MNDNLSAKRKEVEFRLNFTHKTFKIQTYKTFIVMCDENMEKLQIKFSYHKC